MIQKPFISISISKSIENIDCKTVIDILSPFCKIQFYNELDENSDIVISENLDDKKGADYIFILVYFGIDHIREDKRFRVFQPFINQYPQEITDCTDHIIHYVRSLISIYDLPISKKNATLELE